MACLSGLFERNDDVLYICYDNQAYMNTGVQRSGATPADTVKVARLATESGLFPVFEAEDGQVVSSSRIRHQVPVTDCLRLQARYAHLFRPQERTDVIERLQACADRNISRFDLLEEQKPAHIERTRLTLGTVHDSEQRR